MELSFAVDGFRGLYALITAFMWVISTLFSFEYMAHYKNKNRYYFFLLLTLGATVGIFLSADFFTMFVFFEIMSMASYVWVAQDEKKESLRAAETYLGIAVIGGLCILMGMMLLFNEVGSLSTAGEIGGGLLGVSGGASAQSGIQRGRVLAAGILMLVGFGAKAGAVPLHIWLPKAHPVAPAPASALLSGVLTKTGVFGTMLLTLRVFFGNYNFGLLIFGLGILTMVTGAVLALFSVDLKRTLACSSVSQIGFIFTGVGTAGLFSGSESVAEEGYIMSLSGGILHMVNHSLIKLVLFCAAGVVFMNLHQLNLNEIRGFGRKKPLLHAIFLAGALGIAGVPLFNAYVSKSLLHEGIVHLQEKQPALWLKAAEWIFIFSGGLTAAYMTKLYVSLFWEKNVDADKQTAYDEKKRYMRPLSAVLLSIAALLLPILGVAAGINESVFNFESLWGALLSLLIGAFIYLLPVRCFLMKDGKYAEIWRPEWDLEDRVYRPLLHGLELALSTVCRFLDRLPDYLVVGLRKSVYKDSPLPHELEEGNVLTHAVGGFLDWVKQVLNRTFRRKRPIEISFEHKLAMLLEQAKENNTLIGRSLSFGLLLFCIGLLMTLAYMLMICMSTF
ncbi:MAG: NADH dehydrogenase [Lachnospiraceae bacterium]|nr:NADH dehydrogenase [Lachnospiraceae bacterium]